MSETHTLQATDTTPEDKAIIGRPTIYSEALARSIFEQLESGTTLVQICLQRDMPSTTTVYRWKHENSAFQERFTRARHNQMHTWADESVLIADDGTTDYIIKKGRNGVEYEALDTEHVQRSKLRVDTRLRLMAAVAPHLYGPSVEVKHSGEVNHTLDLSDRERMRRFACLLIENEKAGALIEGKATETATPQAAAPDNQ